LLSEALDARRAFPVIATPTGGVHIIKRVFATVRKRFHVVNLHFLDVHFAAAITTAPCGFFVHLLPLFF
jgi:hypothetical protein